MLFTDPMFPIGRHVEHGSTQVGRCPCGLRVRCPAERLRLSKDVASSPSSAGAKVGAVAGVGVISAPKVACSPGLTKPHQAVGHQDR